MFIEKLASLQCWLQLKCDSHHDFFEVQLVFGPFKGILNDSSCHRSAAH